MLPYEMNISMDEYKNTQLPKFENDLKIKGVLLRACIEKILE